MGYANGAAVQGFWKGASNAFGWGKLSVGDWTIFFSFVSDFSKEGSNTPHSHRVVHFYDAFSSAIPTKDGVPPRDAHPDD